MSWRPHGRARVDANNPAAFGWCDRCQFEYNLRDLSWQHEWQGVALQNRRLLVCSTCLDKPQEQLRAIVLPADPEPVQNPRPPRSAPASALAPLPAGATASYVTEDGQLVYGTEGGSAEYTTEE